jgi:RNA polymerase sigma-70 factor (ECF subfamily)
MTHPWGIADRPGADDPHDARVFIRERPRLVGLAYRLLGSVADAEDVVQEAWLRWAAADRTVIERPAAWLTTVVSRLGLDRLRAVQRARLDYIGPWLPEPIVVPISVSEPERMAELADSLTTAFLVMLEQLSPEERLVILLVDVFGEPFRAAAQSLDRSEDACRQLAVRARHKLNITARQRLAADTSTHGIIDDGQLAIATAFAGAVMSGDLDTVKAMLTPTAVLISDGGPHRHAARRPVVGRERIARFVVNLGRRVSPDAEFEPVWVNGRPGALISVGNNPYMVTAVDAVDGLIDRYWSFLNPDKLHAVRRRLDLL